MRPNLFLRHLSLTKGKGDITYIYDVKSDPSFSLSAQQPWIECVLYVIAIRLSCCLSILSDYLHLTLDIYLYTSTEPKRECRKGKRGSEILVHSMVHGLDFYIPVCLYYALQYSLNDGDYKLE